MTAIQKISSWMDDLVALRRDLHAHPELGFEEVRTAGIVAERLRALGYEVTTGIGGTGVVGVLSTGPGPRIGLRADMDALPVTEATGLAFASTAPGRMHACGHDGHTTMLLAAARWLAETRAFRGTLVLVFQPAEEGLGGARAMIADGLFRRFPCDEIYALHNAPHHPKGVLKLAPGAAMAAADFFDITLTGRGMHAGMPNLGADPIVAAGALIQGLQSVVSRNVDPVRPAVVSVTRIAAGAAYNVVPGTAALAGTARTLDDATRALVRARIEALSRDIAAGYGCTAEVTFRDVFSVLDNHPAQAAAMAEAAAEVLGAANVDAAAAPMMGSEDFADMLLAVPGAYAFLGQDGTGPLHSPAYSFDDDIIPLGAALLARIAERRMA